MEKLEVRRDKERAADRAADLLQNQQVMFQMMQQLFPPSSIQQTPGMTPGQVPGTSVLPSGTPPIAIPSTHQRSEADELAASMDRTKLTTVESEKKRKTEDRMNLEHENEYPQLLPSGSCK